MRSFSRWFHGRSTAGQLTVLFVLIIPFLAAAAIASRAGWLGADTTSSAWTSDERVLLRYEADMDIAQKAGNIQHAAQIRENIVRLCQSDGGMKPDATQSHQNVQVGCALAGIAVP